jgi:hypothetical protein
MNKLGANLGAAFRDVAKPQSGLLLQEFSAIVHVQGMHFQRCQTDEKARSGKILFVVFVIPDHMAHVLAQKALDALVKFLPPIDVLLIHSPGPVGLFWLWLERGDRFRFLVIKRDVGDQIPNNGKGFHRSNSNQLAGFKKVHACHAHESGLAVDLGTARSAFTGLTVPPDCQVIRPGSLDGMNEVKNNHSFFRRNAIFPKCPTCAVAAPTRIMTMRVAIIVDPR